MKSLHITSDLHKNYLILQNYGSTQITSHTCTQITMATTTDIHYIPGACFQHYILNLATYTFEFF